MPLPTALRPPKDYKGPRRLSSGPVDNTRIIAKDRAIKGVLETSIHSELLAPGREGVIIQSTAHVYGAHNRKVLIPAGSRFVCDAHPPEHIASTRLCDLQSGVSGGKSGRDSQSRQYGLGCPKPSRDHRIRRSAFLERYGTAFALTGISTGVEIATALTQPEQRSPGTVAASLRAGRFGTRHPTG